MPNFRLTLAYDGTDFSGSQVQPGERTVQGELERTLSELAKGPVRTIFAGRTDRGVHAIGQVVAAQVPSWAGSPADLGRALRATLPSDLVATSVETSHATFNPRFDAAWREYRYWVAPCVASPFLGRYAWMRRAGVLQSAVADGARKLVGTHDFASFAGGGEGVPWSGRSQRPRGTVRTILRCECREVSVNWGPSVDILARVLEIRVAGDGFLPQMVRTIVGALVEVGQGRHDPSLIEDVLAARDRRAGPMAAPPQGLTLWRVGFADDRLEDWAIEAPLRRWMVEGVG
jgi:tRNA pseudouridine38-40 synthase